MTETENVPPRPTPLTDAPRPPDDSRRVWQSDELLAGECEAVIVHRGQVYRLRCTKQGKLILYK